MSNARTFSLNLSEYIKKTKVDLDTAVRAIVINVDSRIIDKSPVGDRERWAENIDRRARGLKPLPKGYIGGRFRGNWQLGLNVIPTLIDTERIDAAGNVTIESHLEMLASYKAGDTVYIVNNLPYAQRIEEGWSSAAPAGVVGLTLIEFSKR